MKVDKNEHAVFLSGNGPLVQVLREALTRDRKNTSDKNGNMLKANDTRREVSTFIQNIHHFRDEYLKCDITPTEKVVVFDEAQRAWNRKKTSAFMKNKKGNPKFQMSEPEFLIDIMNRHVDWCTIICLIGGGQEINTGEAGLEEWIESLKNHYPKWNIHFPKSIISCSSYFSSDNLKNWISKNGYNGEKLHLSVSLRSFRSEKLSTFVEALLSIEKTNAKDIYNEIKEDYPILISRNLDLSKKWIRNKARGNERIGILVSSGSRRLRPCGIDAENGIRSDSGKDKISNWFLNDKEDIRSSSFLEIPATEFAVQGLELDWICLSWGGNFHYDNGKWIYMQFRGNKWNSIRQEINQNYLINTFRVLLTRARQGMVIYIPEGSEEDITRPKKFYDGTFKYLKDIGINVLTDE